MRGHRRSKIDLGTIDGLGRDVRSLVAALLGMTKFDVSRSR
jgi:hypothetical protein